MYRADQLVICFLSTEARCPDHMCPSICWSLNQTPPKMITKIYLENNNWTQDVSSRTCEPLQPDGKVNVKAGLKQSHILCVLDVEGKPNTRIYVVAGVRANAEQWITPTILWPENSDVWKVWHLLRWDCIACQLPIYIYSSLSNYCKFILMQFFLKYYKR